VEPHYHLPIFTCPRCQNTQVRRRHPLLQLQRQVRRGISITLHLIVRVSVIYIIAVTLYILMRGLVPQWKSLLLNYEYLNTNKPGELYDFFIKEVAPFISWVCTAIAGGAVVGGFFHHWNRWKAWAFWFVFLLILVSDDTLYDLTFGAYEYIFSIKNPHFWSTGWLSWSTNAKAAILTFLCSFTGAPIGWMLIKSGENKRKRKFHKRRCKRRKMQREG